MLTIHGVADAALKNLLLLEQVVYNKSIFFRDNNASYETAKIGSLRLLPHEGLLNELRRDYSDMHEMFMVDAPDFDVVMSTLQKLEEKINRTAGKY